MKITRDHPARPMIENAKIDLFYAQQRLHNLGTGDYTDAARLALAKAAFDKIGNVQVVLKELDDLLSSKEEA